MPVNGPWPISMCLLSTVTVLSGPMMRKVFGAMLTFAAAGGVCANDLAAACEIDADRKTRAGLEDRTPRSVDATFVFDLSPAVMSHGSVMAQPSSDLRSAMDGGANANVGGAAADVAVHGEVDVAIRRRRVEAEQRRGAHDLAGLAIAALRHVERDPRLLHGGALLAVQALDGRDLAAADRRDRQRARAHRLAVDIHRARAALRDAAAVFRAGEPDAIADCPQQGRIGIDIDLMIFDR